MDKIENTGIESENTSILLQFQKGLLNKYHLWKMPVFISNIIPQCVGIFYSSGFKLSRKPLMLFLCVKSMLKVNYIFLIEEMA